MKPNLITVIGNTGVGKSKLAVEIAKAVNGEIINGDSMQVYSGANIITNKHPMDEREGIPHHLLGHVSWSEEYSVQQFEKDATEKIFDIHRRGKIPVLVGGTHYYNQALLFENSTIANSQKNAGSSSKVELSNEVKHLLDNHQQVLAKLKELDPVILNKFHPNDTRRLRRALEIYYETGKRASDIYREQQEGALELRYRSLVLWIYCEGSQLDKRLDSRVDSMLEQGLENEIRELHDYRKDGKVSADTSGVFQSIGYKEFLPYLSSNQREDLNEGIELMKIATRQYAKRQTKWVRKKLLVMLEDQLRKNPECGGYFAALDSTNLDEWDEVVGARGVKISQEFLKKDPPEFSESLIPSYLQEEVSSKGIGFNNQQDWKQFTCQTCSTQEGPMTLVGQRAWEIHLSSRKHKKAVALMKHKDRRSTQTNHSSERDPFQQT